MSERRTEAAAAVEQGVRPLLLRRELVDGLLRLVDTTDDKAAARVLAEAADMLRLDGVVFDHLTGIVKQARN